MKLTAKGEQFREAAAWAAKIAPTNPPGTPVLAGVKLTAADELTLAVTDLETFGTATVQTAVVQDAGTVVVSARLLAAVAKVAPAGADVVMVFDGARLEIRSGRSRWALPTMDGSLWPQFPRPGEVVGRVGGEALGVALSRVTPASDVECKLKEERLRGVYMEFGDHLILSATNTHRLAYLPVEWERLTESADGSVIVSAAALKYIGTDGDLTISTDGGILGLSTRHHAVIVRLITGRYLKVLPVIEESARKVTTVVTAGTGALRNAVNSAAVFLDERSHLAVSFTPEEVTVTKIGGDDEADTSADTSADVQTFSGEPVTVAVRADNIRSALDCLHAPSALFTLQSDVKPFLIQPSNEAGEPADGYRHVLMPIHPGNDQAAS